MFEFLIFVILGSVLFVSLAVSKGAGSAVTRDIKNDVAMRSKLINEWKDKHYDPELECDIRDFTDIETYNAMRQRIIDETQLEPRVFDYINPDNPNKRFETNSLVLIGLLAQHGKINSSVDGLQEGFICERSSRGLHASDARYRFYVWLDKELREHGFDEPLMCAGKNTNGLIPIADMPFDEPVWVLFPSMAQWAWDKPGRFRQEHFFDNKNIFKVN